MGKDKKQNLGKAVKQDQGRLRGQSDRPVIRKIKDLKPYEDKKRDSK